MSAPAGRGCSCCDPQRNAEWQARDEAARAADARARRIADGHRLLVETVEAMLGGEPAPPESQDFAPTMAVDGVHHRALVRALGMVRS